MNQGKTKYKNLFAPFKLGKVTLRNRTVMAPMSNALLDENGGVTQRHIDYFVERAKNDVGLVIIHPAYIVKSLRPAHLSIADDRYIPGLSELVEGVKAVGSRIVLQLSHRGTQEIGQVGRGVDELSKAEVEEFVGLFVNAAVRAKKAGFDGIELHGAHGYFVNQFLSPLDNHREDEYGQDRIKFPREVILGIRRECGPDFLILFRVSAEEMVPGGLTLEDTTKIALEMEKAGVDALHVSAGRTETYEYAIPPMSLPVGLNVHRAQTLKQRLSIPVIVAGRIINLDLAENILAEAKADLIAFGRELIADPEFVTKGRTGHSSDIRPCLSCNYCYNKRLKSFLPIRCAVNPFAGREGKYSLQQTIGKDVWVIGGGPAGMEAAKVAALRGHRVTLWERNSQLGGKLLSAKVPPDKGLIQSFLDYQIKQIQTLGIKVNLNSTLERETMAKVRPELVIVATGSRPTRGNIEILDEENLTTAEDMLLANNKGELANTIVILGGGLVGAELADYLSETSGKEIIILEMLQQVATDVEPLTRKLLLNRLENKGVRLICGVSVQRIERNNVVFKNQIGEMSTLQSDLTVLALGYTPELTFIDEIPEGVQVQVIGDANEAKGDLANAVYTGFLAGISC